MKSTSPYPLTPFISIVLALAIAAICTDIFYIGFLASDDSLYNSYASQLAAGNFTLPVKHWAFRYTVIVPLAGLINIFGVGESTIQILTFTYVGMMLALLIIITQRIAGHTAAFMTALFAATAPMLVTSASILNADVPEALFLLTSIALFYVGWHHRPHTNKWFLGAGLAAGMAMLTRETAYGIGLFYALFALRFAMQRMRPFVWLAIGTFLVIGAEMLMYAAAGESPFYRLISATQTHGGLNAAGPQFAAGTGNVSDSRIWGAPLALLLNQEFGLLFWIGIGCAIALRRHPQLGAEAARFLRYSYIAGGVYFLWLGYSGTIRPLPRYFVFDLAIIILPIAIFVSVTPSRLLKALVVTATLGASLAGLAVENVNQRYPDRMVAEFVMRTGAIVATDGETLSRAQSFLTLMGGDRSRLIELTGHESTAEYFAAVDGRYSAETARAADIKASAAVERAPAPKLVVGHILDITRLARLLPADKYHWLAVRTPDVTFYRLPR